MEMLMEIGMTTFCITSVEVKADPSLPIYSTTTDNRVILKEGASFDYSDCIYTYVRTPCFRS
jgi:hypothetical protein